MSSAASKRRRRARTKQIDKAQNEPVVSSKSAPALPIWNWRTFPVIAAFGFGGFLGMIFGNIGDPIHTIALFIFVGILGFSLSRLAIRFLMAKGLIKPQPQRKR
tara:strand:+ start:439 stop:750 length:312 start_codon:yes stop_codon:yes gene_type:complete